MNPVFWKEHEKVCYVHDIYEGGQLAAVERLQGLLDEVLAFIEQVWTDRKDFCSEDIACSDRSEAYLIPCWTNGDIKH